MIKVTENVKVQSKNYENNKRLLTGNIKLTPEDVLLVPAYGILDSRSQVKPKRYIYTAPMDKVTDLNIYQKAVVDTQTVIPVLSRVYLEDFFSSLYSNSIGYIERLVTGGFLSIGSSDEDVDKLFRLTDTFRFCTLPKNYFNICVDVAHGHSLKALRTVSRLKELGFENIMSGSIVTPEAAIDCINAGCTHLRTNVGSGGVCSTRQIVGVGYPSLSAIFEIYEAVNNLSAQKIITLISDGGIRFGGTISKLLCGGADAVMIGSAFAGCKDSPATEENGYKIQRGQASEAFQNQYYGTVRNNAAEGVERKIPVDIPFLNKVNWFHGGVRSAVSYLGLESIDDMNPYNCRFVQVSPLSVSETYPIN